MEKNRKSVILAMAASVVLAMSGCVTDDLSGGAIGAVQTGVDVAAAKYGATPYVAGAREKLAEAEAAKVGRVLLPRGVGLAYDSYLDGRMINLSPYTHLTLPTIYPV